MDDTNSEYLKCPYAVFHNNYAGWSVETFGHSVATVQSFFQKRFDKPKLFTIYTKKGDGCITMEKNPTIWHHKAPNDEELKTLLEELDNA